jgi:hypothetical protein
MGSHRVLCRRPRPEAQFTDAEVKAAVDGAREGLTGAKAKRVGNLLRNLLNSWPILARFEEVLQVEGLQYTDEDCERIKASARRAAGLSTAPRRTPATTRSIRRSAS